MYNRFLYTIVKHDLFLNPLNFKNPLLLILYSMIEIPIASAVSAINFPST